jgi:chromosome segregation ATPase
VHPTLPSSPDPGAALQVTDELLGGRIEALAGWLHELDAQLRALAVSSDEKTLKELRAALEAWSKRDPKFEAKLTERVDVLSDRLATLSSAVNTAAAAHAGADGELASLRRELEQETAKLEAALQKRLQGSQAESDKLEELRRSIAELSADRPGKRADKTLADLRARIDYVAERVDTLATTVATTAAGLAGREGDLVALRRSLDDANAQLAALAKLPRDAGRAEVTELRAQLETLGNDVHATEELLASRLRSLDEGLKERVGAVEAALREIPEAPEAPSRTELEELLAPVQAQVETLAGRLQESDTLADEHLERERSRVSEVERRLGEADRRLTELDETRTQLDASVREIQTVLATPPESSVVDLDEQLEPITTRLDTLAGRLDTLDEGNEATAAEVARASGAAAEELAWLREHVDALVQAVAETPTKTDLEEPLTAVSVRLDELERERTDLAAELARVADEAAAERKTLEARLDQLTEREAPVPPSQDEELKGLLVAFADRIEAIELERTAEKEAARTGEDEAAAVRASLIALESRLSSAEELMAAENAHDDLASRFDTLAARLESLEKTVNEPRPAATLAPGDGRVRIELRALELRLEHAEAAAREHQEAVLGQLERLAARLGWVQDPENGRNGGEETPLAAEPFGEVVPIRGGAEP